MHEPNEYTSINTFNINDNGTTSSTIEVNVTLCKEICKLPKLQVIKMSTKKQWLLNFDITFPILPIGPIFGLYRPSSTFLRPAAQAHEASDGSHGSETQDERIETYNSVHLQCQNNHCDSDYNTSMVPDCHEEFQWYLHDLIHVWETKSRQEDPKASSKTV